MLINSERKQNSPSVVTFWAKRRVIFTRQGRRFICQEVSLLWDQFKMLLCCFIPCQHHWQEALVPKTRLSQKTSFRSQFKEMSRMFRSNGISNKKCLRRFVRERDRSRSVDISRVNTFYQGSTKTLLLCGHKPWLELPVEGNNTFQFHPLPEITEWSGDGFLITRPVQSHWAVTMKSLIH